MYGPAVGTGQVMEYIAQTGLDALKGADMLKVAPRRYRSEVEYADNNIARSLRDVAKVHTADLGTRVFYTQHGSFDTHAGQAPTHAQLWTEVSEASRISGTTSGRTTPMTTSSCSCSRSSVAA